MPNKLRRYGGVATVLMAIAVGPWLSACNTVAGAGQDMQDLGRNMQNNAAAAKPPPQPPPPPPRPAY
jgi:predicted small secreted protein